LRFDFGRNKLLLTYPDGSTEEFDPGPGGFDIGIAVPLWWWELAKVVIKYVVLPLIFRACTVQPLGDPE